MKNSIVARLSTHNHDGDYNLHHFWESHHALDDLLDVGEESTREEGQANSDDVLKELIEAAEHAHLDFTGGDFAKTHLAGFNWTGATLTMCDFTGAFLAGGVFRSADASYVEFRGANLQKCDFTYTDLCMSDLTGSDLRLAFFVEADLRGARLVEADLRGACFHDCNLEGVNFSGARFDQKSRLPFDQSTALKMGLVYPDLKVLQGIEENLYGQSTRPH